MAGIGEAQNGLIEVIIIGGPGGYHDDKGRNVSKTQHIDQRIGQIIGLEGAGKDCTADHYCGITNGKAQNDADGGVLHSLGVSGEILHNRHAYNKAAHHQRHGGSEGDRLNWGCRNDLAGRDYCKRLYHTADHQQEQQRYTELGQNLDALITHNGRYHHK
ncbi:Uncharacterised protein [uncultured Blautia sp.]|nr:Uncharacterised protein [uncultured Blautia sp.]